MRQWYTYFIRKKDKWDSDIRILFEKKINEIVVYVFYSEKKINEIVV